MESFVNAVALFRDGYIMKINCEDSAGADGLGKLLPQGLAPYPLVLQSGKKDFGGTTVFSKLEELCVAYTKGVQLLGLS